jgi:hypothetical protein
MTLQRHQLSIPLLTQDTFTAVTLTDHIDIVIRNDLWRLDLAGHEPETHTVDANGRKACLAVWRATPDDSTYRCLSGPLKTGHIQLFVIALLLQTSVTTRNQVVFDCWSHHMNRH